MERKRPLRIVDGYAGWGVDLGDAFDCSTGVSPRTLTPWPALDACLIPPVVQPLAPGQSLFDRLEHVSCHGIGGIQ